MTIFEYFTLFSICIIILSLIGCVSGYVGKREGHNFLLFFVLGLFISPIGAIIVANFIPAKK